MVNGSVTPVVLKFVPAVNSWIDEMVIQVQGGGNFTAEKYGALAKLTNGINVGVYNVADDALEADMTAGHPIRSNSEWAGTGAILTFETFGSGDNFMTARWVAPSTGMPLFIAGQLQYLAVTINDDLSTLTDHHFLIMGSQ